MRPVEEAGALELSAEGQVTRLDALREALDARAAGLWAVRADHLELQAFSAGAALEPSVADRFRAATRRIDRSQRELGVVQASEGRVVVSEAKDLPPELGSGYWLRAFEAERSIAVPILSRTGAVAGVVSIAVCGPISTIPTVEERLRSFGAGGSGSRESG